MTPPPNGQRTRARRCGSSFQFRVFTSVIFRILANSLVEGGLDCNFHYMNGDQRYTVICNGDCINVHVAVKSEQGVIQLKVTSTEFLDEDQVNTIQQIYNKSTKL